MKLLQSLSDEKQQALKLQFPELRDVRENEDHSMGRFAISVFDHWLRDESEWHLMDCFDGPERSERDQKFRQHWALLFESTEVYTVRYRGRWPRKSKLIIKKYLNKSGFLQQCRIDPTRSPKQFIILPEYDCLFAASWDDTNVCFFNSRERAEPIISLAQQCGLYCLEFET
ncbi:hypothetical protein RF679_16300 [Undibacterium cyanobacteriorum]|uniref:Uncharacterized protein n=1 Tax=Undibacterium cyanobacteriorum TaxID=3073561 RepID=A0ABY9RG46_9BURK|nr:hypothetical protein [Undibacterium sp. 20NA77.5]WMW80195.1 hypothetical protein RF679_16300 [Undibacterium sp. 20NA77.5]